MPGTYWVASTEKAANQIVEAIESKKKVAYITKRWELISLLLKIVPDRVYNAIGGL
jgi:short-subunit dehydrogenase